AVHTSRDPAATEPLREAHLTLGRAPSFAAMLRGHARAWDALWRRCDVVLEGHAEAQRILRLHVFHLLQVASPHVVGRDVGLPARGLHGEAYRGHVFWDELFIFPLLRSGAPELTRALLMYRHNRLDAARRRARELGHAGAAYPWQSGSSGREETPYAYFNPRSGRWIVDETEYQFHIGAAVAWNVWAYYEATGDDAWLRFYGAEMLLEIARFWASIASWDPRFSRYRIRGVVGPDEFHTAYPGADRPGIDDNAYTNVMAAWCLRIAEVALEAIGKERRDELLDDLDIDAVERAHWRDVAAKLHVPFHDGHIISQFEGYAALPELDWDGLRARHGDIHRLDLVLEAEGDTPSRYKASKQADVLMLFYLLSADQLAELLHSMGYAFDKQWIPENVDYYLRRTSHGSTLSRVVHAWVLARSDRARSFHLFQEALRSDVDDIQGGTTPEGIHLGAMAGAVDLLKRCYTGAVIRDGTLWLSPRLPDPLSLLRTRFLIHGAWLDVEVTRRDVEVVYSNGHAPTARVGIIDTVHTLECNRPRRFPLPPERAG
ncbi:MAG TPA: glycosyl hydrolase family 65 protein, partial [Nannocystis sp.]